MTEAKRPLKVFLCHAHADRDAMRGLYTRLTKDGVDAWLDKEKLLPGQDWELEIRKAVREADVVVVCLSKQFNQAGFRQKEVRLALDTAMEKPEGEIFVIPARLEECDTLESLRKWHWVDLFEEGGYDKLTQALSLRARQVNAHFVRKLVLKVEPGSYILVGQPATLSKLGAVHQKAGDFSKATEYFESALLLSRGIGDKKAEATILSNLGNVYETLGDLVRATELYEQALVIRGDTTDGSQAGLWLDDEYSVWRDTVLLGQLPDSQFKLLKYLIDHRGQVCSYQTLHTVIYDEVGSSDSEVLSFVPIDQLVKRLRKFVEIDPSHPKLIKNIPGNGYVLE